MKTLTINFSRDFTDCPGGRLKDHGEFSGEEFREHVLKPALAANDKVVLNLNGAFGYPSSFIDEAFGILVEHLGFETIQTKLEICLDDDPLALREIEEVMQSHRNNGKRA